MLAQLLRRHGEEAPGRQGGPRSNVRPEAILLDVTVEPTGGSALREGFGRQLHQKA